MLVDTLKQIANDFGLNASELIGYVDEDTIGGYHSNPELSKWRVGSMWEVEAQVIYALIRMAKPRLVLELGRLEGCSTTHVAEALYRNGNGKVISVDRGDLTKFPSRYDGIIRQVQYDMFDYQWPKRPKVDFVIDDLIHTEESCAYIWSKFSSSAQANSFIISHDSEHYRIGNGVKQGISTVTTEFKSYLIPPASCGLAIWRK